MTNCYGLGVTNRVQATVKLDGPMPPRMQFRPRHAVLPTLIPTALAALALAPVAAAPQRDASTRLYQLETTCSLRGAKPVDCVVEASEENGATVYRHTIGSVVETIRITDGPLRMTRFDKTAGQWIPLRSAEAQFSTNTVCFDGRDLCVLNPNYLNSVREERVDALEGRDRVLVRFGPDGRVLLTCYDQGCEGLQ